MYDDVMVDNFDIFPWVFVPGEFYYVQVIERHKDNPSKSGLNGGNSCRVIRSYSIYDQQQLDKYKKSIVELCGKYLARAYIHPARRSKQSIAHTMVKMLGENLLDSKHNLARLYESACGHNRGVDRIWVIDCDDVTLDEVVALCEDIDKGYPPFYTTKYYLPTVNGYHIITEPFDLREFNYGHDIHKNNPTLLYFNPQNTNSI